MAHTQRFTCLSSLRLLLPALFLVVLVAGMAQAQTFQALDGFDLVDANGTRVSVFYPSLGSGIGAGSGFVAFKIDRDIVRVRFGNRQLLGENLLFETLNCSSTPFLDAMRDARNVAVGPPGHTLYLPDTTVTAVQRTIRSQILGTRCHTFRNPSSRSVIPARPLFNLETRFTPPFRVRPRVSQTPEP